MDTKHIVKSYDDDLSRLGNMIAEMGGLVEMQLARAVEALANFDADAARDIVAKDKSIDAFEMEIDDFIIKVMALRQPVARDLRSVIIGLKISSNLERIGDYAKNIAKRTTTLSHSSMTPLLVEGPINTISRMAQIVQQMIKNVLDAYIAGDADKADDVRAKDENVDQLYSGLFRELLTYMMEDPRNITPCTHLLFVAKNVERMGDHVTGIAEQIHFMVHGAMPDEERIRGDDTSINISNI
jgi:phosphate transport system protein